MSRLRPIGGCEILSPSTMWLDRAEKLPIYGPFGVGPAWDVDPTAKTLDVFALEAGRWVIAATVSDADPITVPPFEAHTFALHALWPADPAGSAARSYCVFSPPIRSSRSAKWLRSMAIPATPTTMVSPLRAWYRGQ